MKSNYILFSFLIGIIAFVFTSLIWITKTQHPEILLRGEWKEVSWNYERVDKKGQETQLNLDDEVKQEISKNLIIHQTEKWEFKKGSTLILKAKGGNKTKLKWRLKGRGHILKLIYNDGMKEFYQIKELTKDKLVLHFENDIHARGIVKIIFTK
jgi:hypothetical protein